MMLLSVAFSANIGGTGTLIGTAPNLVMVEFLSDYPQQPISFLSWMEFSIPQVSHIRWQKPRMKEPEV